MPIAAAAAGIISRPDCQAGMPRPELVEQRQQERQAADAEPGDEAAGNGDAEGADAEQRQAQQRMRLPARACTT